MLELDWPRRSGGGPAAVRCSISIGSRAELLAAARALAVAPPQGERRHARKSRYRRHLTARCPGEGKPAWNLSRMRCGGLSPGLPATCFGGMVWWRPPWSSC